MNSRMQRVGLVGLVSFWSIVTLNHFVVYADIGLVKHVRFRNAFVVRGAIQDLMANIFVACLLAALLWLLAFLINDRSTSSASVAGLSYRDAVILVGQSHFWLACWAALCCIGFVYAYLVESSRPLTLGWTLGYATPARVAAEMAFCATLARLISSTLGTSVLRSVIIGGLPLGLVRSLDLMHYFHLL